jgi:FKBP-type peptidyl-prolyl cis-trans isomerase
MDLEEQEKNQIVKQLESEESTNYYLEKAKENEMIISQDDILVTSNVNLEENSNENQDEESHKETDERPTTPVSPKIDASLIKSQEFRSIENETQFIDSSTIEIEPQNDLTVSQEGYFNVKSDDLATNEHTQELILENENESKKNNNEDLPKLESIENLNANLTSINPLEQSQESFLNIANTNTDHKDEDYEIINKTDAADYESPKKKDRDTFYDMLGNGSLTKRVIHFGDESKRPLNGQICTISYTARLENGSIVERQDDYQFIIGDGDVVPALDMAVSLVELNEEWEIISESRHAYGEKGK